MRCPRCGIEMAVGQRGEAESEGRAVTVLRFVCRNRNCPNYGPGQDGSLKVIAEKRVFAEREKL